LRDDVIEYRVYAMGVVQVQPIDHFVRSRDAASGSAVRVDEQRNLQRTSQTFGRHMSQQSPRWLIDVPTGDQAVTGAVMRQQLRVVVGALRSQAVQRVIEAGPWIMAIELR
jgi:hypothetical protein